MVILQNVIEERYVTRRYCFATEVSFITFNNVTRKHVLTMVVAYDVRSRQRSSQVVVRVCNSSKQCYKCLCQVKIRDFG